MSPKYRPQSTPDKHAPVRKYRPAEHDQDRDVDDEGRIEDGLTRAASETEDALRKRRAQERQEIGRPRDASKR